MLTEEDHYGLAEEELEQLGDDGMEEHSMAFSATSFAPSSEERRLGSPDPAGEPTAEETNAVVADAAAVVSELGLDDVGESAASSSGLPPPSEPPPPPPPAEAPSHDDEPTLEEMGETHPSGRIYLRGRSVLQVQRGKPKGSVYVTCYCRGHTGCHLLIDSRRAPDDIEFKKWWFEVEEAPAGASSAQRKALAKRHMDIGRARWYAK